MVFGYRDRADLNPRDTTAAMAYPSQGEGSFPGGKVANARANAGEKIGPPSFPIRGIDRCCRSRTCIGLRVLLDDFFCRSDGRRSAPIVVGHTNRNPSSRSRGQALFAERHSLAIARTSIPGPPSWAMTTSPRAVIKSRRIAETFPDRAGSRRRRTCGYCRIKSRDLPRAVGRTVIGHDQLKPIGQLGQHLQNLFDPGGERSLNIVHGQQHAERTIQNPVPPDLDAVA